MQIRKHGHVMRCYRMAFRTKQNAADGEADKEHGHKGQSKYSAVVRATRHSPQLLIQKFLVASIHLFRLPQIGTKPNAPEPPTLHTAHHTKLRQLQSVRDAISRHFKLKPTQARFDPSTSLRNKASRRPDDRFPAGRH